MKKNKREKLLQFLCKELMHENNYANRYSIWCAVESLLREYKEFKVKEIKRSLPYLQFPG